MHDPFQGKKLELDYPAEWTYKLIGPDESRMRAAVVEVIGDRDHQLTPSNTSAGGRYRSLTLVMTVDSEEHRKEVGNRLHFHVDIRIVI